MRHSHFTRGFCSLDQTLRMSQSGKLPCQCSAFPPTSVFHAPLSYAPSYHCIKILFEFYSTLLCSKQPDYILLLFSHPNIYYSPLYVRNPGPSASSPLLGPFGTKDPSYSCETPQQQAHSR